jgi:hypothetical protein
MNKKIPYSIPIVENILEAQHAIPFHAFETQLTILSKHIKTSCLKPMSIYNPLIICSREQDWAPCNIFIFFFFPSLFLIVGVYWSDN